MSDKELALSERLKVWEATGMSVTLNQRQIKELRRNLDTVTNYLVETAIEAKKDRRRAFWYLIAASGIATPHAILNLIEFLK